jgi:hypothetical protein
MGVRTSNEQEAIQYLLGNLSEAEQSRLEERFFQDVELSELLSEIEDDLIDQYVRGELSNRERERFEHHFLISERRRQKVDFARALLQAEKARMASSIASIEKPASAWKSRLSFLYSPRPALVYSMAAVMLLFLLGGAWPFSEVRQLRKEIAQMETERQLNAQQEEQLRNQMAEQLQHNDELAAQNEKLEQEMALLKQQSAAPPLLPSILAFILSPGSRGGARPKNLIIPRSVQTLRLQLNLNAGDEYASYQVSLQSASGEAVRIWNGLRDASITGGRAIYVNVPARLLSAGQYELRLSGVAGAGQIEDLGYYYFNLTKE